MPGLLVSTPSSQSSVEINKAAIKAMQQMSKQAADKTHDIASSATSNSSDSIRSKSSTTSKSRTVSPICFQTLYYSSKLV
ncbi:hypothetical protein HDU78_002446 [Chytriomyces hyalinus]|nr:hypothetical protein HDU78_002446 [Chytriomyces hyalinus]